MPRTNIVFKVQPILYEDIMTNIHMQLERIWIHANDKLYMIIHQNNPERMLRALVDGLVVAYILQWMI